MEHQPGKKHQNADALSRCMEGCEEIQAMRFPEGRLTTLDELRETEVHYVRTVQTRSQKKAEQEQQALHTGTEQVQKHQ